VKSRFRLTRRKAMITTALAAIAVSIAALGVTAIADNDDTESEHWGVITRNTNGSPVGDLRDGPFGTFENTGPGISPPYGDGSLGIEVRGTSSNPSFPSDVPAEKVDFGNEIDFRGDSVLALNKVGFHVFQVNENISYGGPRNMPNIRFEIDANLSTLPADNYTTMVWVPDAAPQTQRWSEFIDATSTGEWYFTGAEGGATGCSQATPCTFAQAKSALNDGSPRPTFHTVAVGKGRDNMWIGAVDGLRLNDTTYDFEREGVRELNRRGHHRWDDD
jgi:hypothetical protein